MRRRISALLLATLAGCASRSSATVIPKLCEVPTKQLLRSADGDSIGVFTALVPCDTPGVRLPTPAAPPPRTG
jgi:hypothetical protein